MKFDSFESLIDNLIIEFYIMVSAIKSALKQENLNPEIEEKLLQLQRYQEKKQSKPEGREVVEREVRAIAIPAHSPSPPPRRRVTSRHDDDDEWVDMSPRKRPRSVRQPTPPPPPRPPARAPPAPPPPQAAAPPPAPPPPSPADERRRAASTQSRLQMLLFKHKELLKKDIIKKRGLLEKELGVEIQVISS